MDRQQSILGEHKDDHLDQVAGPIRTKHEDPRGIRLGIWVGNDERVVVGMAVVGMADVIVVDPVTTSRAVDVHTSCSVIHYCD